MNTGSIAANPHEGSRSEYLAQYVFAAFGTSVAVPHQEDSGIDLYCTLTELVGRLAWPRAHYTVQVKSNEKPWTFGTPESVRWLLEHPLPLFLCTVDKSAASLRVFRTDVRFAANFPRTPPKQVRLHVHAPENLEQSDEVFDLLLREPILDATIVKLLDESVRALWKAILFDWVGVEEESLLRWRLGVKSIVDPTYRTNERPDWSTHARTEATLAPWAIPRLVEFLQDVANAFYLADDGDPHAFLTEALVCLLHWQLAQRNGAENIMASHQRLSARLQEQQPFGGAERLIEIIRQNIAGIVERG
jgi:hypothetical protein